MPAKPNASAATSRSSPRRPRTKSSRKRQARKPDGPKRLAKALAERGWMQRDLALELKVSKSTVTRWLNGERLPSRDHMRKLEELLEIPLGAWM